MSWDFQMKENKEEREPQSVTRSISEKFTTNRESIRSFDKKKTVCIEETQIEYVISWKTFRILRENGREELPWSPLVNARCQNKEVPPKKCITFFSVFVYFQQNDLFCFWNELSYVNPRSLISFTYAWEIYYLNVVRFGSQLVQKVLSHRALLYDDAARNLLKEHLMTNWSVRRRKWTPILSRHMVTQVEPLLFYMRGPKRPASTLNQ